jgi:hypothetical protein
MKTILLVLGTMVFANNTFAHDVQCLLSAHYKIVVSSCEGTVGEGKFVLPVCGPVDFAEGTMVFKKADSGVRTWNEGKTSNRAEKLTLIANQYGIPSKKPYINIEVLSVDGANKSSKGFPELNIGASGISPKFELNAPAMSQDYYSLGLVLDNPQYGPCEFPAE